MFVRRRLLIGFATIVALAALWLVRPRTLRPCYLVVLDRSGAALHRVELAVREHDGDGAITRSMVALRDGGLVRVPHGWTDSNLEVRCLLHDQEVRHHGRYADLWRREGWRIDVGPGGVVSSHYDGVADSCRATWPGVMPRG